MDPGFEVQVVMLRVVLWHDCGCAKFAVVRSALPALLAPNVCKGVVELHDSGFNGLTELVDKSKTACYVRFSTNCGIFAKPAEDVQNHWNVFPFVWDIFNSNRQGTKSNRMACA